MFNANRLPGATILAKNIERRRFIRNTASTLFFASVATATGAVSIGTFLADPAAATGACCPNCCGNSPCCNTFCCGKNCCSGGFCISTKDGTCQGGDFGFYNHGGAFGNCWTCGSAGSGTMCCDCRTDNTKGCSNFTNRCICPSFF
jgi:hypothetical protein